MDSRITSFIVRKLNNSEYFSNVTLSFERNFSIQICFDSKLNTSYITVFNTTEGTNYLNLYLNNLSIPNLLDEYLLNKEDIEITIRYKNNNVYYNLTFFLFETPSEDLKLELTNYNNTHIVKIYSQQKIYFYSMLDYETIKAIINSLKERINETK